MAIDPLLTLLAQKARYSHQELADLLSLTEAEVAAKMAEYEANGTILGYQTVIDPELSGNTDVSAFIEVKLTPERGGGFDRLAMRIAKFDQVESCYLISGGYDLNVVVVGADLRDVARFVSEKLSTIDGVLSTATHFRLKTYKQNGFVFEVEEPEGRLSVAP
ncbi:MAG: Lrp/AsnC family transcriptional regulator [Akkermansiaceae bacterium]